MAKPGAATVNRVKKMKRKSGGLLNTLSKRHRGFTLVEIMIVVAIIALLATIALPGFLRARKRTAASKILNDLRAIDSAVDQYALENGKEGGASVAVADWTSYVKAGTPLFETGAYRPYGEYGPQTVDSVPKVTAPGFTAFADLSDVAPSTFWTPFYETP